VTPALPDWPDVLATALVGTERRTVHSVVSTVEEPPLALLDSAALLTAYRRAGVRAVTGVEPPAPAPDESTPVVGDAAATRLAQLLDQYPGAGPLDAELRAELLVEWLTRAAAVGRRCPPELLPALLDAGRRDKRFRRPAVAVGGARTAWLAGQRAEWRYVTGERDESGAAEPEAWQFGTAGQRVAHLAALRSADPDAARELLAAGWAGEAPDERAALLAVLRTGLGPADEEFLEAALVDRRKEVRTVAGDLLGQLPGSAYRERMVRRARACVRRDGNRLVVTSPDRCDTAMKRDGITPKPPQGVGERAWWLEEVLARTPVDTWTDGDPAAFLASLTDDWGPVVLRGLARATAAARDPEWAVAVFDRLFAVPRQDRRGTDAELLDAVIAVVPDDRLAERVVVQLHQDPSGARGLDGLLARCPRPWPPSLVDGLLAVLALPAEQLGNQWRVASLCRLAATRLPVEAVDRVAALAGSAQARARELADRLERFMAARDRRADPATAAPGTAGIDATVRSQLSGAESLTRDLHMIVDVLRLRHDLIEELS
jgi:hypothetical protein